MSYYEDDDEWYEPESWPEELQTANIKDFTVSTEPQEVQKTIFTIEIDADKYIRGSIQDEIIEQISIRVASMAENSVKERVIERVEAHINDQFDRIAKEKIEEYFNKPHKKTNQWGDPTGNEYTIRELLCDTIKNYMDEKVDPDNGKKSGYSGAIPRTEWILKQFAHRPLAESLQTEVKKISDEARKQVQGLISRYIAEQLTPAINVPQLPKGVA